MSVTRLILHIGRNKAGSTSLQDFCAGHAGWLADNGVQYVLLDHKADRRHGAAALPAVANHHELIRFVRGADRRTVLASNELFAALSPSLAADAARDLAALDVRILVYVRPYRNWLRSGYSYDVRTGTNGRDFDAYVRHMQPLVSLWPALRTWGEAVGWHRMHVRTTDARDLQGGDLIGDCLATMDLAPPSARPGRSNTAAHWMAVELLRLAVGRDQAPGWNRPEGLAVAQTLHEVAEQAIAETGHADDPVTYTTRAQAASLQALYNEDLCRITAATGARLTPDDARQRSERAFLPSAEHVPADILSRITALACGADWAHQHPELAAFVRAPLFAGLHARARRGALAPPAGPPYLAKAGAGSGAPMTHSVAEPDSVLPRAEEAFRLAELGDLSGAIGAGTMAARARADSDLLNALARWRHEAFIGQAHPPGLPIWPPHLADPFPGVQGVPGIDARDLTADILGGAIVHHGSLHVRGLVSRAEAEALRLGIDRALAAQQRAMALEPEEDAGWFVPFDVPQMHGARQWPHGADTMYTADSPPMLQALIDALGASGVVDRIAEFMGERPALSVAKSTLRRQQAVPVSGWHQDGAFLGRQVRSVNVWLALSDCGTTAPGMDVIGRRLPYVVQTASHGALFDWSVGQGVVDMLAEGGAVVQTPEFQAGDALLFDHLMLHRTSLRPGATDTRWAIESWFFAPTDYPYDRVPLLV